MTAPLGRRRCEVAGVEDVGAYRLVRLADPGGPPPAPGQFVMVACVEGWGAGDRERPYLPRALSVMRSIGEEFHLLLDDVGPGTARLRALVEGEEVWITGPLGVGFTTPADGRRALLVGGGVGVPPLVGLQDALRSLAIPQHALVGFRDAEHAVAAQLMESADVATDNGAVGHHGLVTELLTRELDADPAVTVYSCGPPGLLEAVRAICEEREIPAQLALESPMACGYGACYGCVVATRDAGYVRICVDGPVLDASRIVAGAIR